MKRLSRYEYEYIKPRREGSYIVALLCCFGAALVIIIQIVRALF